MRKILIGGVGGAVPGLVIVLIPLLLHTFGVISADQSQVGFIGVPLLFIGVLVGTLVAASGSEHEGKVLLGLAVGFAVGLATGLLVDRVLTVAGAGVPGIWLVVSVATMILGAVLGASWGEHDDGQRRSGPRSHGPTTARPSHV